MSAETLRRAASLMREQAEAATPGPWQDFAGQSVDGGPILHGISGADLEVDVCLTESTPQASMDRAHIASWHPAVALAVADWLDAEVKACGGTDAGIKRRHGANSPMLRLARAYLGESA